MIATYLMRKTLTIAANFALKEGSKILSFNKRASFCLRFEFNNGKGTIIESTIISLSEYKTAFKSYTSYFQNYILLW